MGTNKQIEKLIDKARSKIFWGHPVLDVKRELVEQGIPVEETLCLVNDMMKERKIIIKEHGKQSIKQGLIASSVSTLTIIAILIVGYIPLKITGFLALGVLYGIYMIFDGRYYYFNSKKYQGSVHDL